MPVVTFKVETEEIVRLDTYCSTIQGISRSRLKNGLTLVKVNGVEAKLSLKLKGGEKVELEWEDPIPEAIIAEDIPLEIMYENDDVTIINKKQGMVTHPGAGNWRGTLVNALLYHWGRHDIENVGESEFRNQRPGIVHRLDKDTSGVLITARNRDAEQWLQEQFKKRRVRKEYIAIVLGHPPAKHGSIKTQIVRDSRNRKKFVTSDDPQKGKFAHTVYYCIGMYGPYSLMRVKLKTGRTHQIRVHMKHIGCPILGDPIYGKPDGLFESASLMLHARTLGIRLPNDETFKLFTAAVPIRFKKVLKTLHEKWDKATFKKLYNLYE
jgi:23S rRNA pseudouridine1911/1915/1917 synthase